MKNIQKDNLITFLKRYESYLTGRDFSFELNEDDELDFKTLCQVLMNPSEVMDIDFVEALFFIQEMSDDEHFEELSEQAEANNIDVHEDSTLIETWLRKRGFVSEQKEEESTQSVTHQESHDAVSIAAMAQTH